MCYPHTGSLVDARGDFTTFSLSLQTVSFVALKYFFLQRLFDLSLPLLRVVDGANAFLCCFFDVTTGFRLAWLWQELFPLNEDS